MTVASLGSRSSRGCSRGTLKTQCSLQGPASFGMVVHLDDGRGHGLAAEVARRTCVSKAALVCSCEVLANKLIRCSRHGVSGRCRSVRGSRGRVVRGQEFMKAKATRIEAEYKLVVDLGGDIGVIPRSDCLE